ncbi:MAG: Gfo/Idh/MocA family oxidoreductase, partial [Planctomycetaceae bacterium]
MSSLRLAVIGTGVIGQAHARRIDRDSSCSLVAVCDSDSRCRSLANELNTHFFLDAVELLRQETLDGVIIATPNTSHSALAITCLERGLPVLIEKPIADTTEAALSIAAAA